MAVNAPSAVGLLVGLWFLGPFLQSRPAAASEDEGAGVRAAILGYADNRRSFRHYECRYVVTQAQADSFADAKAGRWDNPLSAEYRMLIRDEWALYEVLRLPPVGKPKPPETLPGTQLMKQMVPFLHCDFLTDGEREVLHAPSMRVINLFDSSFPGSPPEFTPFSMGCLGNPNNWQGPDALLLQRADQWQFEPLGLQEYSGRPVWAARFTAPKCKEVQEFRLDPSQGYLPVEVTWNRSDLPPLPGGRARSNAFLVDAKRCENGGWFPMRSLHIYSLDNASQAYRVLEIKVTELETETPPDWEEFTLTIPAGTAVCSDLDYSKHLRLKQQEKINAEDLPALFDLWSKAGTEPLMDTAIPRLGRFRWWHWAGFGAAGLVVLWLAWRFAGRRWLLRSA